MRDNVRQELERAGRVLLSTFWDTYSIEKEEWYLLRDAAGALWVQYLVSDAFLGGEIRQERWSLITAKGAVPEYIWKAVEPLIDPEDLAG